MSSRVEFKRNLPWAIVVASWLAGVALVTTIVFVADVKASIGQLSLSSKSLGESAIESDYAYEVDAFEAPSELPLSQFIIAIYLSPAKGLKVLQEIAFQPEFVQRQKSPAIQHRLIDRDIFSLKEDATLDQLIAKAAVKDLWALQRELEVLTDSSL